MKLIELTNIIENNGYYELTVIYRQLIPDSILNDPVLLAKAPDIAVLNNAYYEKIDGVQYISRNRHYSYNFNPETGEYSIEGRTCKNQNDLLELFKKYHEEGVDELSQQVEILLAYKDVIPQGLTKKYYDGKEWQDGE
jgi:hypothetical protein